MKQQRSSDRREGKSCEARCHRADQNRAEGRHRQEIGRGDVCERNGSQASHGGQAHENDERERQDDARHKPDLAMRQSAAVREESPDTAEAPYRDPRPFEFFYKLPNLVDLRLVKEIAVIVDFTRRLATARFVERI